MGARGQSTWDGNLNTEWCELARYTSQTFAEPVFMPSAVLADEM